MLQMLHPLKNFLRAWLRRARERMRASFTAFLATVQPMPEPNLVYRKPVLDRAFGRVILFVQYYIAMKIIRLNFCMSKFHNKLFTDFALKKITLFTLIFEKLWSKSPKKTLSNSKIILHPILGIGLILDSRNPQNPISGKR